MLHLSPFAPANHALPRAQKEITFRGETAQKETEELQGITIDPASSPKTSALRSLSIQEHKGPDAPATNFPKEALPKESPKDVFHLSIAPQKPKDVSVPPSPSLSRRMKREVGHQIRYIVRSDDPFWGCSAIASAASPWVLLSKAAKVIFTLGLAGTFIRIGVNYYRNRKSEMSARIHREMSQTGSNESPSQ